MISDGECAEGSIWEALRIIYDRKILNLKIIVSVNGWGAYDPIDGRILEKRLRGFGFKLIKVDGHRTEEIIEALNSEYLKPTLIYAKTVSTQFPFLVSQDAHYYTMNENDYKLVMEILK